MASISNLLGSDHARCDTVFAQAEQHVLAGQWDAADAAFKAFAHHLQAHMQAEEDVLFPAFEQAAGSSSGPTAVMRSEHQTMRATLAAALAALAVRDAAAFLGDLDALRILMGQHNMKEEGILYPMADRLLHERRELLVQQIEERLADVQEQAE